MSQYFALPRFRLGVAPIGTRVLITLFLAGTALAIYVSLFTFYDRTGFTLKGIVDYYRGNEGDPAAKEMLFPKTRTEILEVTHIHSFSLLILFFILAHFFALTVLPEGVKIAAYSLNFLSMAGMLAGPWLVTFSGPWYARWFAWSGIIFTAGCTFLALGTLWEIWFGGMIYRSRSQSLKNIETVRAENEEG